MRISRRFSTFAAILVAFVCVTVLSIRGTGATLPLTRAAAGTSGWSRSDPPAPVMGVAPIGGAREVTATDAALQHFQQNVAAYLTLRERVTAGLPELAVTPDPATLERTTDSLAQVIRMARRHALRGDVFTADVARRFRSIISLALRQHGISPSDVLADVREELDEGRTSGQRPTVGINAKFAWGSGSAIPPEILAALPALPKALEYTLVNRDLLLVDAKADLIVDILPDAVQRL
jgi:hypothetical protein